MDSSIKASIDARKNAIVNAYKLDEKTKKEVDDLFNRIEKLGAECKDVGEFETKLAASPLNQEYIDMFTKVATADASAATTQGMAEQMAVGVAESAVRSAIGSTVPTTRAAVNQKVYDVARDIPGVGDAMNIKQHIDLFKRFKKS